MKKSIKKKWLKALRSGEYQQTTGQLRQGSYDGQTSFCCLGVLCNLHAQAHPEIAAQNYDPEHYMGSFGALPLEVVVWAGLDKHATDLEDTEEVNIKVTYRDEETTLIKLNDEEGLSFKKIANVIERCL
jgi:hypothetical protein